MLDPMQYCLYYSKANFLDMAQNGYSGIRNVNA